MSAPPNEPTRLAVLGSPIGHSRSPELHAAAYAVLGLDWRYERAEVTAAQLPAFIAGLGPDWRGLSLTMPLKRAVLPLVAAHDPLVDRLGLANTVLLGEAAPGGVPRLANTDVAGIVRVLQDAGLAHVGRAVVLGAGATAASALEAVALLGATDRVVLARDVPRAGIELGTAVTTVLALDDWDAVIERVVPDVVIATLPGGAQLAARPGLRIPGIPMLDVAYVPWPSTLGAQWTRAGGTLLHGLDMLIEQAVLQVRLFVAGDVDAVLPREPAVRAAMRAAVGRPGNPGDEPRSDRL